MAHSVAFNTLAYAKKLEACGVAVNQAEGHAEALADVLEINFTSKKDADITYDKLSNKIDALEQRLNGKIDALEQKMDNKIDALEQKMDNKIEALEQKLNGRIDALEQKMDALEHRIDSKINQSKIDVIKWFIGVSFAQTALILSVLKFIH